MIFDFRSALSKLFHFHSGTGKLDFDSFCRVATHFLDEDDEALQRELKQAFRLYDKEGEIRINSDPS